MQSLYKILWGNHGKDMFLYGTKIRMEDDGSIFLHGELMPSGKSLRIWHSVRDYQKDRMEPELPLLIEGQTYFLKAVLKTNPADTVFLRVCFYDRQEELLQTAVCDVRGESFTCPLQTWRYTIELVNAGINRMRFRYLELIETDE